MLFGLFVVVFSILLVWTGVKNMHPTQVVKDLAQGKLPA